MPEKTKSPPETKNSLDGVVEATGGLDDPGLSAALSGNLKETPRTKEALKRCGVLMSELKIKSFQDFHRPTDTIEKQRLRYNHYETRRQAKLSLVLQERAKVFVEMTKKQTEGNSNVKSYQGMHMLEQLLDAEAGRLEGELKQQLRYHTVVENENKEQLEKEQALREKQKKRTEKSNLVKEEKAARVKQNAVGNDAKLEHSRKILKDIKQNHEAKCANFLSHVLETEVRIREFRASQSGRNFEKSEAWKGKVANIQKNFETIQEERMIHGLKQLKKKEAKFALNDEKKKREVAANEVRNAEKQLRVIDVLDKKHRIDRQIEARNDRMREEATHAHSRITTLLNLKDQIVKQRKARIFQQSALKGRALNIKNIPTGPGQYDIDRDRVLREQPVPRMPLPPKNHEGGSLLLSSTGPPPGSYDVQLLPDGKRIDTAVNRTVIFTKGSVPNFIEDNVRKFRDNPGPGTYKVAGSGIDENAPTAVIRPDMVKAENKGGEQLYVPPAWAEDFAKTPGPAAYLTDKFLRDEESSKRMETIPNLGKAIALQK
ncbi:unnamed protein product [Amoebophrya sp. A120]|nr:unnamed protein product [Amoebophrya sp. A120]|eukprot:GSA120T00001847001.1